MSSTAEISAKELVDGDGALEGMKVQKNTR